MKKPALGVTPVPRHPYPEQRFRLSTSRDMIVMHTPTCLKVRLDPQCKLGPELKLELTLWLRRFYNQRGVTVIYEEPAA